MSRTTTLPDTAVRPHSAFTLAMVAPSLDILGGQGVQAKSLADALRLAGFHVMFIAINPAFPAPLRWLRAIPVVRTIINQLLYLPSLLQLRRADAVHVFSASYWSFLLAPVPAMLMARLFGKPVVLNYHSGEADDHLRHWGWLVHPWLKLANEIVVPSRYLQGVFARYRYPTRVINNMIDTTSFRFRPRSPLRPRLLSVRNLESHYRVDNTLRAFALVQKHYPDATLVIAGYGSQEGLLKDWVQAHGLRGVCFAGRVEPEAMPALYDEADILVNSSVVDNQPLSILEACAAGLTVVSTPTGDIPALVQDGAGGYLVPANDPTAMAKAILAALEHPSLTETMARQARAGAEQHTGQRICHEWTELYLDRAA